MIFQNFKKLLGKNYYPLNQIALSKNRLISNYRYLCKVNKDLKIAPVLKSNAYGHGSVQIAKMLDELGCPFFCVDSLYEAYELLRAYVKTPILIMGYVDPANLKVKKLPFSYAVYDLELLDVINRFQAGAKVHIKVDTGMHRFGIPLDNLGEFLEKARKFRDIEIEGLMSHLASSQDPGSSLTSAQIKNFDKAQTIFSDFGIYPKWQHLAASRALLKIDKRKLGKISNLARAGIALYGVIGQDVRVKPVLTLTSKIAQIKELKRGDQVGYEGAYVALGKMLLGVLPIGYNDGVDRRLSNRGFVLVGSKACPIVGRVSMNITTIDLSAVKNPKVGQRAVVFADDPKKPNSLENSAKICETIPHELLVHLSPTSIKREII